MDHLGKSWAPENLMELLSGVLDDGASVPLVVSGSSMVPFLVHGRDTVYLTKITKPIKRGDILLYRRNSGKLVLHRVCRLTADGFTMAGDAQQETEPGIKPEQLLAVVTAVRRKGKLLTRSDWQWKIFETLWLWLIPWRKSLLAGYGAITRKRR